MHPVAVAVTIVAILTPTMRKSTKSRTIGAIQVSALNVKTRNAMEAKPGSLAIKKLGSLAIKLLRELFDSVPQCVQGRVQSKSPSKGLQRRGWLVEP